MRIATRSSCNIRACCAPSRCSVAESRMSADHAAAPASVAVHIVTVSDTRTLETDSSGRAIAELLERRRPRGAGRTVLKDEPADVRQTVTALVEDPAVDAVITTGGTGITSRDSTFEAVDGLLQKRLVGFGELFRMLSYQDIGAAAMLSRATAGLAGRTVDHRAAGIRTRGPARHGETGAAGVGAPGARGTTLMAYRPDRRTMSIDEARAMLAVHGEPIAGVERSPVDAAAGRVVARDVFAERDVPPFARAAMDGYAVKRHRHRRRLAATRRSSCAGRDRSSPGSVPTRAVELGECAGIATGAPMPKGADAVVMVEQSSADGGRVLVFEPVAPAAARRPRRRRPRRGRDGAWRGHGADAGAHRRRRSARTERPRGLRAARVAILSTGRRDRRAGRTARAGQIFDANTSALAAAVAAHGGEPVVAAAHAATTGPR